MPGHLLRRKDFFKVAAGLGGMALTSLLLEACSPETPEATQILAPTAVKTMPPLAGEMPTAAATGTAALQPPTDAVPTSTPNPTPAASRAATPTAAPVRRDPMTQVALVKTGDRLAGIPRALDLLGIDPPSGKHLFVKPNLNSADPPPGSTHNDTMGALIHYLQAQGADRITIGDRSGMGDTRWVMEQKGIFELGQELGVDAVVLDELEAGDWELITLDGSHWQRGFALPRPVLEADGVVQTCCLKTHRYGGHFTMSLKNSVGLVAKSVPGEAYNYMNELHSSPYQRRMIAEVNAAYQPDLVLLDGVEAFVEGGPATGKRVQANLILAGTDRVAIDAIGVAVLRLFGTTPEVSRGTVFQQEQIARAVELGVGVDSPDKIELITDDAESAAYARQILEVLLGS